MNLTFDVSRTPFSRLGSYFAVAWRDRSDLSLGPGLYLRSVHGMGVVVPDLFRIEWADGTPLTLDQVEADPVHLTIRHPSGGHAAVCITDPTTVRVRGQDVPGLRFSTIPDVGLVVYPAEAGRWVVNRRRSYRRYGFEAIAGGLAADAPTELTRRHTLAHPHAAMVVTGDAEGGFDLAIDELTASWDLRPRPPFDACLVQVQADFDAWLAGMPAVAPQWQPALDWAAYVDWSCVVEPCDRLKRPAMFMSKNHMNQVWSWDHCFNAMALVYGHPELAYDQLMMMADHQDAHGAYPDGVNDFVLHYNFSKPPVHGWALGLMRDRAPALFTEQRLAEAYASFSRLAAWWLTYRVAPGNRLPYYLHGNDSGWDNSTMFDQGVPLIAPDLAAVLAEHCFQIADVAEQLARGEDARRWRATAQRLVDDLLATLWREDHFVALRQVDGAVVDCESLVPCIPIVLGERLPVDVRQSLVGRIRRFVTEHGLATEHPDSPHYEPDGYWRGPIWAPSTLLIVSGLAAVGEHALARTISERFCRTCARSGFAENFDALTGEGLRDPAYTWTASVFIVLAHEVAS